MPTLIQNYKEKQTVTQVKRLYSLFSQALLMARAEKGDYQSDNVNTQSFHDYIVPYLKIQKDCRTKQGCFAKSVKKLDGSDFTNINSAVFYTKVILASGETVQFYNWPNSRNEAEIRVDINGFKEPNTIGRDIFYFKITNNKLIPGYGDKVDEDGNKIAQEVSCNAAISGGGDIEDSGEDCTYWVLHYENMDYLH